MLAGVLAERDNKAAFLASRLAAEWFWQTYPTESSLRLPGQFTFMPFNVGRRAGNHSTCRSSGPASRLVPPSAVIVRREGGHATGKTGRSCAPALVPALSGDRREAPCLPGRRL
jgi:hypothetical protein